MQVIYVGRNVKDICVSSFYHVRPDTNFSKYVFRLVNAPCHTHISCITDGLKHLRTVKPWLAIGLSI